MAKIQPDKNIHSDSKHAKRHGKELVREDSCLHLDQPHKDWYNRSEMGKQLGKPKAVPAKKYKAKKTWKKK